jgi:hypothetical protein
LTTKTVDSIAIVIAREFYFNSNIQTKTTINGEHEVITETTANHGLTIVINRQRSETRITISSKILGKDFLELIHLGNISTVHKVLTLYIPLSLEDLLFSTICKADPAVYVIVENKGQTIADLFDMAGLQTTYKRSAKVFKSNGEPTSFGMKKENIGTENIDYLSVYCKFEELTNKSKKGNRAFLESLNPEERKKILDDSKQLIKFEVKLSSRRQIRKHYGLPDKVIPRLIDILTSEANVPKNMVERIYNPVLTSTVPTHAAINMVDLAHILALANHDFCIDRTLNYLNYTVRVTNKARTRKRLQALAIAADEDNYNKQKETYLTIIDLLTKNENNSHI